MMKHFRSSDYIYYDFKSKPLTKRPKPTKKLAKKTHQPQISSTINRTISNTEPAFLNQITAYKVNFVSDRESEGCGFYQRSLTLMQKAVNEQENMYQEYFFRCTEGSHIRYNIALEIPPSIIQLATEERTINTSQYFSSLLEDPLDKDNLLFTEQTLCEMEAEAQESQEVADYDVSAYFDV